MATIEEIAKRSGFSSATVSRILNNDPSLSVTDATRESVLRAAQELNYKKRSPNTSSSQTVCVGIFSNISAKREQEDPYFFEVRQGAEQYCSEHHYEMVHAFSEDPKSMNYLQRADVLIAIGTFSEELQPSLMAISEHAVFTYIVPYRYSCCSVTPNYDQGMTEALHYLYSNGHRKIAFLACPMPVLRAEDNGFRYKTRLDCFTEYCDLHSIEYRPYLMQDGTTAEAGYKMAEKLIAGGDLPTAVFAFNDAVAMGVMRAFHEHGIRVPEDISIIGFDDISAAAYLNPPLTTVALSSGTIGRYAAHMAVSMFHDKESSFDTPLQVTVPCRLVVRSSSASLL